MPSAEPVLKVQVVITSLGQGGAEQSMMALLPPLRDHGISPDLLLLQSVSPEREAALAETGVPVRVVEHASNPLALARSLRKILRAERPDLLHATLFDPIIASAFAAIGTGVPVLASQAITPPETRRGHPVDTSGSLWKVRLAVGVEALVSRHLVTHLHAVTPGVRDVVAERYRIDPARITVAERGRDQQRFGPPSALERAEARAEFGVGPDDQVLVALGRHEPSKGFGDLVETVARIAPGHPRLRVLLAGRDGTFSAELRRKIAEAGLTDRFLLLGDRPDPERVLAAGDLFVLSSRREGTSGATIEAMATGLPVVATDLPGLQGIVIDGVQARIVPVADPARMAEAITEVLDDPELAARLGQEGRRTFLERFTLERATASLAELYRSVALAGRTKARSAGSR